MPQTHAKFVFPAFDMIHIGTIIETKLFKDFRITFQFPVNFPKPAMIGNAYLKQGLVS